MQQKLPKPIMISFHTFAPDQAYSNPRCVWWDQSSMDWSSSGCALEWHNTHTMCHCFHFAHYAVVMDVRMAARGLDQLDSESRLPLVSDIIITLGLYAACFTTIFCLLACLTCLYWFSDSSCERVCIHKHFCLVLLVSEVLMLVGLSMTDNEVLCSILAGLLHYFLLSVLSWALLSCFQLYYSLVKKNLAPQPFSKHNRQLYFYSFGYGCPAILVLISLYWNYPPAALLLLSSTILLAIVLLVVCQASKLGYKPCKQKVTEDANIVKTARADFKSTAALVLLLALCCTFGILWLVKDGSTASWRMNQGMCMLFSAANAMLGLVILLGFVVFNQKLQKDYLKWLQVNDWVPECLRPTGADHSNSSSTSSTSCHDARPPSSSTHSTANSATCASSIDTSECLLFSSPCQINDTLNRPPTNLSHLLLPGQQYRGQDDAFGMENNNEGTYDYATIAYGDLLPLEFQQHLSQYPGTNGHIRFQPNHNYPTSHRSQPPQTTLTKSVRRVETPKVPPFSSASSSSGFESASSTGRTPYYQPYRTAPPNFPPPPPPPGHPDDLEDEAKETTADALPCPASPTPSSVSRAVVRMDFSRQQPLYSEEIQEN
uniref:Uncharacterized protein n=1 Tax=Ditylenchus dipsaci TaxID=166011 RepID=A0A915D0L6_9BILA